MTKDNDKKTKEPNDEVIALTMDVTDQFTQNPEYFTVPISTMEEWAVRHKDDFDIQI